MKSILLRGETTWREFKLTLPPSSQNLLDAGLCERGLMAQGRFGDVIYEHLTKVLIATIYLPPSNGYNTATPECNLV